MFGLKNSVFILGLIYPIVYSLKGISYKLPVCILVCFLVLRYSHLQDKVRRHQHVL